MNFRQKISKYFLGFLTTKDIPDIGVTGLEEGLDSKNMRIVAGLAENENPFLAEDYLLKAIKDFGLTIPDRKEATLNVIIFHADKITSKQVDPYDGFKEIDRTIKQTGFDWDHFDLWYLYCDYIAIWETLSDGLILYDKDKQSKEDYIDKEKKKLVVNLTKWVNKQTPHNKMLLQ